MKKIGTVFMATLLILDGMFGEINVQAATFEQLGQNEEQKRIHSMEMDQGGVEVTTSPMVKEYVAVSTVSPAATGVVSGGGMSTEEPNKDNPKGDVTVGPKPTDNSPGGEWPENTLKPGTSNVPTRMPEVTSKPSSTTVPVEPEETTAIPEASKCPVVTMAPNVTKMPISTQKPIVTRMPEKTLEPVQATASPTIRPNATTGTAVTATEKPSDSNVDGNTKNPASTTCPKPDDGAVDDVVYCLVHYKLNGGTNATGNPSRVYASGASYQLKNPKKKGYSFEGWYLESSFKHRVYYVEPKGASNVTYYAKWKIVTVSKAKITSAKRLKNGKIRVKVGNYSGADGYEYVYSLTPAMSKKLLVRSVKNPKDLTRLKKKARYYIKVRCYKYDSWGRKIYGSYSKVVKCK